MLSDTISQLEQVTRGSDIAWNSRNGGQLEEGKAIHSLTFFWLHYSNPFSTRFFFWFLAWEVNPDSAVDPLPLPFSIIDEAEWMDEHIKAMLLWAYTITYKYYCMILHAQFQKS